MQSERHRLPDPNDLSLNDFAQQLRAGGLVERLLKLARDEDMGVPAKDWTGELMFRPEATREVRLRAREAGIVSGLAFLPDMIAVFSPAAQIEYECQIQDGERVDPGATIATLRGNAREIVALERTMLNLISRMSGIATRTKMFVDLVNGTDAKVCDTRKTTPGLRVFEKYAVRCGSGTTHRIGLYDAVLIKDNHIEGLSPEQIATSLQDAAYTLVEQGACLQFMQIEVDSLDQLESVLEVCSGIVEIILLDNMDPEQLAQAVQMRDQKGVRVLLEASGGVSEQTIRSVALSGVDRVSVGGLTHQARSLDFGLDT
ncbi:MAG: carboxylating nicotinate-nucleotide diphosphorylase [Phycisphaerales bacterium JB052]